ncbi:MAG: restriction endonuclease subunit S [Gammaproteobacteria bacterium]|nr:restriction endonuclease subunit S [Gammaproteobacteria bacterium]
MAYEFLETTLPSLAANVKNAIVGGPFGSNLVSSDYVETGVPVIRGKNMGTGKYIGGKYVFVTDEKAGRLNSNTARPKDLVFTQRGTLGQVALVPDEPWSTYIVSQSQMKATIDPKKANVLFLYYYFSSPREIQYILSNAIQTGVPHTNLTQLKDHPIRLPPLVAQKSIAHILGALDDKIELNHKMNATLEAMAQALFKSWFVDFDPVIDNALAAGHPIPETLKERAEARLALGEKRKPLPEDIRKQFPVSFEFVEEMEWVPEGWNIDSIENISSAIGMGPFGSNIKVDTFVDSGVPIINGQHLKEVLLVEGNHKFITESHASKLHKSLVFDGDIVFTHRGTIGQVSLVPKSNEFEKFIVSQSQFYLRPDIERVSSYYLIHFFRSHIGQSKLLSNSSQVGVPSIARPSTHLKSITLLVPGKDCLSKFDRQCRGLFDSVIGNRVQIKQLEKLRNTLLPELLSGELRIPDAEKIAENAT